MPKSLRPGNCSWPPALALLGPGGDRSPSSTYPNPPRSQSRYPPSRVAIGSRPHSASTSRFQDSRVDTLTIEIFNLAFRPLLGRRRAFAQSPNPSPSPETSFEWSVRARSKRRGTPAPTQDVTCLRAASSQRSHVTRSQLTAPSNWSPFTDSLRCAWGYRQLFFQRYPSSPASRDTGHDSRLQPSGQPSWSGSVDVGADGASCHRFRAISVAVALARAASPPMRAWPPRWAATDLPSPPRIVTW